MEGFLTTNYNPNEMIKRMSQEDLEKLSKMIVVEDCKDALRRAKNIAEFDLPFLMDKWLHDKSKHTVRMYSKYIKDFQEHTSKHLLDITAEDVDSYVNILQDTSSVSKARGAIRALSSLYSTLVRWGKVSGNPFAGVKIKDHENKIKVLIKNEEIEAIEKYFQGSSSTSYQKMLLAIKLMKTYGMRVGFFNENLTYNDGVLRSWNKGKWVSIEDTKNVVANNLEVLYTLRDSAIQSGWKRAAKVLGINKSPHDLRHYFACTEFDKDGNIYRVSQLLRHSSVQVTEVYLRGWGRI